MKKALKMILMVFLITIVLIVGAIFLISRFIGNITNRPEIIQNPKIGEWYRITPDGAISSDGSQWHGLFRKGSENKVIVYFYGGGVSTDAYMAARPEGTEAGFYNPKLTNDGLEAMGIGSSDANNPFKDWTMLVLPYSTGDWHCGTGEFRYTYADGSEKTLYHRGYTNYTLFMQEAMEYIGTPDELLITGFSGGGFAAALLGNDTISRYFPSVKNTTVFAEASFLLNENWRDIAENVWQAPDKISERLVSDNIVLDSLRALSKDHPETKILFSSSVRDNALSSYQNYYTNGVLETSNEIGNVYQENLKLMVKDLQSIPNTGILIWDGYNDKKDSNLTGHTLMFMPMFYSDSLHGITMAEWVMNGINGNVGNHGLDLLDKQY